MGRFRWVLAVSACSALVTVTGCTSLPTNSAPHVLRSYSPEVSEAPAVGPVDGQEPDLLLRGFYAANAIPDGDYEAARSFLTSAAASAWKPSGPALIVDSFGLTTLPGGSPTKRNFAVHGNVVGILSCLLYTSDAADE